MYQQGEYFFVDYEEGTEKEETNEEISNDRTDEEGIETENGQAFEEEQTENEQGVATLAPTGRGARERFEPFWKKDHVCKSTGVIDLVSISCQVQYKFKQICMSYPIHTDEPTTRFTE